MIQSTWAAFEADHADAALAALYGAIAGAGASIDDVVLLQAFARDGSHRDGLVGRIAQTYDLQRQPPLHAVVAAPVSGAALALLVWLRPGGVTRASTACSVIARRDGRLVVMPSVRVTCHDATSGWEESFAALEELLARYALRLEHLVKVWTYYGVTLQPTREHFLVFNEVRKRRFAARRFELTALPDAAPYPASTGVAIGEPGAMLGALAVEGDTRPVALANRAQANPTQYPASVARTPPCFARGVALDLGGERLVLPAGTASVRGSATVHVGDAGAQTAYTIDLLDELLRGTGTHLAGCVVHVRNGDDVPAVRDVCAARLAYVPRVLVHSAASRDDLLVEIDAWARGPGDQNRFERVRKGR